MSQISPTHPIRLSDIESWDFETDIAVIGSGGAIAARGAALSLVRVRFERNEASWRGGALPLSATGDAEDEAAHASLDQREKVKGKFMAAQRDAQHRRLYRMLCRDEDVALLRGIVEGEQEFLHGLGDGVHLVVHALETVIAPRGPRQRLRPVVVSFLKRRLGVIFRGPC